MELREMTEAEQKYTYAQSHQLDAQTSVSATCVETLVPVAKSSIPAGSTTWPI